VPDAAPVAAAVIASDVAPVEEEMPIFGSNSLENPFSSGRWKLRKPNNFVS
jgi:hypothetical protein